MSYDRCPTCRRFDFLDRHKCPPVWEARIYETKRDEEWREIHAEYAEQAASKFCERRDQNGDYDIIRSGSAQVEVRKLGSEDVTFVEISAESVPMYYAREVPHPAHQSASQTVGGERS